MEHKLRMTPAQVLTAAEGAVARAKGYTDDVEFSAEDATRSDPEFLKQVYAAAISAGATTCNVTDTVGYMLPEAFRELVTWLIAEVPGSAIASDSWPATLGTCPTDSARCVAPSSGATSCSIRTRATGRFFS